MVDIRNITISYYRYVREDSNVYIQMVHMSSVVLTDIFLENIHRNYFMDKYYHYIF